MPDDIVAPNEMLQVNECKKKITADDIDRKINPSFHHDSVWESLISVFFLGNQTVNRK